MGLLRLLLLFALGWLAWRLLSRALHPPAPPRGAGDDYQRLTRCSICGTHIPQPASGSAQVCERCSRR